MRRNPLVRAIARGLRPSGDLATELERLGEYRVRRRREARAICKGLQILASWPEHDRRFPSMLTALLRLFYSAEHRGLEVLYYEGLPLLISLLDARIEHASGREAEALLELLELLATFYPSRKTTKKIVEAAHRPLVPYGMRWFEILKRMGKHHRYAGYLFKALSDPLPEGAIQLALLQSANLAAERQDIQHHPFDTPEGCKVLREHIAYARYAPWICDAVAALPYISDPPRQELIELALEHEDRRVQLEAARAAARLGQVVGLKRLAQLCGEVNFSNLAAWYLQELDRRDLIPLSARDPSFQARAELAYWLRESGTSHRTPDVLEVVDHRVLAWPPERIPKPVWLIRFSIRSDAGLGDDLTGLGMAGSIVYAFTEHQMHRRPPEDVYAFHCYAELHRSGLIKVLEPRDASEYAEMVRHWRGGPLQQPEVKVVAEMSPELQYSSGLTAVATARLAGEEGWVVLDGPRSTWYPKAEQPIDTADAVILGIHIGRQLLGFHDQPDRKAMLRVETPRTTPWQVVSVYEGWIREFSEAEPYRQKELLGYDGSLWRYLDEYITSAVEVRGQTVDDVLFDTLARCLELAAQAHEVVREEAYEFLEDVGYFDFYVDTLLKKGGREEIASLVKLLAPHWKRWEGYTQLGRAAFLIGDLEAAEAYLSKLLDEYEEHFAAEEIRYLAEIWHGSGQREQARVLLIECMQKLKEFLAKCETHSDRDYLINVYDSHRGTYLRLFPGSATELEKLGLPAQL